MARRLILDTSVLIASEGDRDRLRSVIGKDDDIVIAAITVAELRTGVELADEQRRLTRAAFVQSVLATIPVEPYDVETAEAHARLLAHVHREGRARGAQGLVIAATAVATNRTLLTTDQRARFDSLPGVQCLEVTDRQDPPARRH